MSWIQRIVSSRRLSSIICDLIIYVSKGDARLEMGGVEKISTSESKKKNQISHNIYICMKLNLETSYER